ncbi:MAG: thiamine-phosphate kinase [Gemmatimonadetes bacterium]|nr:thiamine-phosphate kinase [Gemmatimonadota bacterium]
MTGDSRSENGHFELGGRREFDIIRAMLGVWGPNAHGIGDDAAVLTVPNGHRLLASTDASVEGVHFRREWLTPREIGARAAAAALSDLAAMAATPLGLLLALTLPQSWLPEIEEVARGVGEMASRARCPIVGGNLARADVLSLTITVLGSAVSPLARGGARVGDILYVTGLLGGSASALQALVRGTPVRDADRQRFAAPRPRIDEARWLAERGATAAIDISDGLLADAGHLAAASAVAIELDPARYPCVEGASAAVAAWSGEEYELLVAFPPNFIPDADAFRERFGLPLTAIGRVSSGEGVRERGSAVRVEFQQGHDHFS